MDYMVLGTQQWLNKTYASVSGFNKVTENGKTGWETIYGLRRALQYEMGITALSDNFGPTTESYFTSKVVPKLNALNTSSIKNIVKIIQGAFWCKGINPNVSGVDSVDGSYTKLTQDAVSQLQIMAGLSATGKMSAMLMKALLDMSAFSLVYGGDSNIRTIQQTLNRSYNSYFGLLPCDGIYQRETNEALIYALQAEIGMDVDTANGYYGPGTSANTPTLTKGSSGNFVKILQWALYVNGFNKKAVFDGTYSQYIADEVTSFRIFMVLNPVNNIADLTVIKGLLSSSGNTNRPASACDMATQLSSSQAQLLKNNGFSIVGRYLTGSVGTGANKRDKNLTLQEIKNITNAGLNIFPIYQDGGWSEEYFNASNGASDGDIANQTAFNLGFPFGTTIYFAVDVDIQDGNIAGTVLPYIQNVKAKLDNFGMYKTGIYGTRNVCQKSIDAGYVENCFVSDMSTGFSGNLGFKMPDNWAFDQFFEHEELGFPIDKVAVSDRDHGTKKFMNLDDNLIQKEAVKLFKALGKEFPIKSISVNLETPTQIMNTPSLEIFATLSSSYSHNINKSGMQVQVKNGKISKDIYLDPIKQSVNKYEKYFDVDYNEKFDTLINSLAPTVGEGMIEVGLCARNNLIGTKIVIQKNIGDSTNNGKMELSIEIYSKPLVPTDIIIPQHYYDDLYEKVKNNDLQISKEVINGILACIVVVGIVVLFYFGIGEVTALVTAFFKLLSAIPV